MSMKEHRRIVVLRRVTEGELKLFEAAKLLGLSDRQVKRAWKRYGELGDAGLVHGLRDRPGNRRCQLALRE